MLRVEVSQQGHPSQTYHFRKDRVEVGRGANCDLVLTAPGISTIHAHIVHSEGRCLVIDQNSTNGTYLHGSPIDGPTKVLPYEAVYICSYCLHIEVTQEAAPQETSEPPLVATPEPSPAGSPTQPSAKAEPPAPAQPVRPTIEQAPAPQPQLRERTSNAVAETTLPPKVPSPASKSGAQRITVQTNPDQTSGTQESGIELRRWAVPGAPKHSSQDEQGLARVFAALAQPFIESNTLPKGDEKSRASFFALAQAQLSVNLSPQSSQLGQGAERIVQALCGIGPLSEILRTGLLDPPDTQLVAKAFEPLRIRTHAAKQDWQAQESRTLHPWALNFAAARLLGRPTPPTQSILHQELTNGLRLSYIAPQDLQGGPLLMLHAAPAVAQDWEQYCNTHRLQAHTKALLQEAVNHRSPITIIEAQTGPDSLWSALQSYALEHSSLCRIAWSPYASTCPRAFNFCANESHSEQIARCRQAQGLSLAPILAVDQPNQDCLRALLRGDRSPAFWFRHETKTVDEEPVLAGMQTQLKLQPKAQAGLCVLVGPPGDAVHGQIEQIREFSATPGQPMQARVLLSRQDGQLVPQDSKDNSFHSKAAQRTFTVAPSL